MSSSRKPPSELDRPWVTVILAVRDERAEIADCLAAILAQDYPAERMNVIIADGGSTDGTREWLEEHCRTEPRCRWIDNPEQTASSGLNLAIGQARGDVFVRVDGHCRIAKDYVRLAVETLRDTRADDVGGRLRGLGTSTFGRAVAAATSSHFGTGGGRFHHATEDEWVDTVYLGVWRREAFERFGLFDEHQVRNQDDEWCYRARSRGGRVLCRPALRSETTMRSTPSSLWRQYFGYGLWKVPVWQKHRGQMRPRHFAPVMLVGFGAGLLCAAPFREPALTASLIWWPTYFLLVLGESIRLARRVEGVRFRDVVRALPIMHFAYGLGFFFGMIRFFWRWFYRWPPAPRLSCRKTARASR
ncbi:MAG: glycosyltransferase family 2 protein [Planctomycetota bacterium]